MTGVQTCALPICGKQELKIPVKEHPTPPAPPAAEAPASTNPIRGEPQVPPRGPETALQKTPDEEKTPAAIPLKESVPLSIPTIPPTEIKAESPVITSREEPVEKPEQKTPAEKPKAEVPAPVAVALPKKSEEKKSPKPPSGATYPFSLFLGSVPHLDQAEQGASKYRKNGLPVYYTEVELSKGIWYRLYAGTFESAEQAERFKKEKGLDGAEVKETPFANLIGTFTSQDKLEGKIQSLKSLGFSPYVIKDADGKGRLLVGAFQNEERAKRQHEELQSKGIENQIVER